MSKMISSKRFSPHCMAPTPVIERVPNQALETIKTAEQVKSYILDFSQELATTAEGVENGIAP